MDSKTQAAIEALAETCASADTVVVLTGAGISTPSGIPDFRSDGGLWERFDPTDFFYENFKADPAGFWELRTELQEEVYEGDIEPNPAHTALADLEADGVVDVVATQNIDGLHTDAGSETVLELHGNANWVACERCGERSPMQPILDRVDAGELPPRCESCEGVLKPDVVLFGESLPEAAIREAREKAQAADVFLTIGTSLTVEPAASLPRLAHESGATLGIINLESTPVSSLAEQEIQADVTEAVPQLRDDIRARRRSE